MGIQFNDPTFELPDTFESLLFMPTDLGSAMKFWARGDDVTVTTGTSIAQIIDRSGTGNNLFPAWPGNPPDKVASMINGHAGWLKLVSDGFAPRMHTGTSAGVPPVGIAFDTTSPMWVAMTVAYSGTGPGWLCGVTEGTGGSGYQGWYFGIGGGKVFFEWSAGLGAGDRSITGTTTLVSGHSYNIQATQDATGLVNLYINGAKETTVIVDTLGSTSCYDPTAKLEWAPHDTPNTAVGCVEMLVAAHAPTADEVLGMDTYLNQRYAIH